MVFAPVFSCAAHLWPRPATGGAVLSSSGVGPYGGTTRPRSHVTAGAAAHPRMDGNVSGSALGASALAVAGPHPHAPARGRM
jgi:hypothetical protein